MAGAPKAQKAEQPEGRKVLAQLITAKLENGSTLYFHKGDVLPDGITEESLAHLADLGFISDK